MPNEPRMPLSAAAAARAHARSFTFVARDIADAVAEIRAKLGPEAVVLDIRRCVPSGLSKLWQHPRIEVIACLPEREDGPAEPAPRPSPPPGQETAPPPAPRQSLGREQAMQRYAAATAAASNAVEARVPDATPPSPSPVAEVPEAPVPPKGTWRAAAVLDRLGLTPVHVEQVLEQMRRLHGTDQRLPESLPQELVLVRAALQRLWRPRPVAANAGEGALHVFIGPPGVGKSTVLCKWLAQTVLLAGKSASVWRLDGRTTNASEIVNIYGEILGVRVERSWDGHPQTGTPGFVDLPNVDFQDQEALGVLGKTLEQFRGAQVHLVLNAAYGTSLLMAQARAFAALPVTDLVLTHLDEEIAWGKLWNLVLGTEFALGYLSAGQNIPGRFLVATPEQLCAPLFGVK